MVPTPFSANRCQQTTTIGPNSTLQAKNGFTFLSDWGKCQKKNISRIVKIISVSTNKYLWQHSHTHSLKIATAAFSLPQQNKVIATELVWCAKAWNIYCSALHRKGVPIPEVQGSSPELSTEQALSWEALWQENTGVGQDWFPVWGD